MQLLKHHLHQRKSKPTGLLLAFENSVSLCSEKLTFYSQEPWAAFVKLQPCLLKLAFLSLESWLGLIEYNGENHFKDFRLKRFFFPNKIKVLIFDIFQKNFLLFFFWVGVFRLCQASVTFLIPPVLLNIPTFHSARNI